MRVSKFWSAILKENFIFSFKNTLEMEAYSCVDAEYSRWSWKLQKLVLEWENATSNRITSSDNSNLDKIEQDQIYTIHQQLDEKYETVMKEVKSFFEDSRSSLAPTMAKWRVEFETKLRNVRDYHKDTAWKFCQNAIRGKHAKSEVQTLKDNERSHITELVKKLVSQTDIGKDKDRELTQEDLDELQEKFDSKWKEWMEEINIKYPPPKIENISLEILNCLRTKCNLGAHEGLIMSKVQECPLDQRGRREPLQLTIDQKQHLNFHAKSYKVVKAFKDTTDCLTYTTAGVEKKLALPKEKTATWLSEAKSVLDEQNSSNATLHVIQVVRDLTTKIDTYEDMPEVTFKFTLDYRIDMILEVAGYALHVFTKFQQDMIMNHPDSYLQSLRKTYDTKFITLCNKTALEKAAAMCLTELVNKHFLSVLQSNLAIAIVDDLKQSNPIFYSKKTLKGQILLSLLEKQDFKLYKTYLTNISESYVQWAKEFVEQYCRSANGKWRIVELAEKELSTLVTVIIKAAKPDPAMFHFSQVKQWLMHFHTEVSKYLPLTYEELEDIVDTKEADLNFLTEEFSKQIKRCEENYLARFETPETCELLNMSKWTKHPAEIVQDTIAGCCEQCPFCKEQCEMIDSNHTNDHHCTLHQPLCLGGYRVKDSNVMITDICTERVGSDRKFLHPDFEDDYIDYKKYRQVYSNWFIPNELREVAPYWKWFTAQYINEIAELFEYEIDLPEDWKCVKLEDAKADIEKKYNLRS